MISVTLHPAAPEMLKHGSGHKEDDLLQNRRGISVHPWGQGLSNGQGGWESEVRGLGPGEVV